MDRVRKFLKFEKAEQCLSLIWQKPSLSSINLDQTGRKSLKSSIWSSENTTLLTFKDSRWRSVLRWVHALCWPNLELPDKSKAVKVTMRPMNATPSEVTLTQEEISSFRMDFNLLSDSRTLSSTVSIPCNTTHSKCSMLPNWRSPAVLRLFSPVRSSLWSRAIFVISEIALSVSSRQPFRSKVLRFPSVVRAEIPLSVIEKHWGEKVKICEK